MGGVFGMFVVGGSLSGYLNRTRNATATLDPTAITVSVAAPPPARRPIWHKLEEQDAHFSFATFGESVSLLYLQAMQEMPPPAEFLKTRPFLTPEVVEKLRLRGSMLEEVSHIEVRHVEALDCQVEGAGKAVFKVALESTYSVLRDGRTQDFEASEVWTFKQRPGSPAKLGADQRVFEWYVTAFDVQALDERKPEVTPAVKKPPTMIVRPAQMESVGSFLSGLFSTPCPACGKDTLKVRSRTIEEATEFCDGRAFRTEKCDYCWHEASYEVRIPR
jgi:hypothetical protein